MHATVRRGQKGIPLVPIPGAPPNLVALTPGCAFAPRCPLVREQCRQALPELHRLSPGHHVRCHLAPERFGCSASATSSSSSRS
jgi:oligopeptide/dipeptide ABC transporter ATP-binding protein